MGREMALRAKIRVGDGTSHKVVVIEGFPTMFCYDKPMAGLGHHVTCPKCPGVHTIVEGVASFVVDGIPIAVEGMKTSCGATLIASQQTDCVDLVSGPSRTASDSSNEPGADTSVDVDEEILQQWFSLEDGQGKPVDGYKYDLFKDDDLYAKAASYQSGDTQIVNGDADLRIVVWLANDSASKV